MAKRTIAKENVGKIITELSILDPWSIYAAEALIGRGFPPPLIKRLTRKFESNLDDPKQTITKGGQIVPKLEGVYSLELARAVARELGVKYEPALGRGTEYWRIVDALKAANGPGSISPTKA